MRRPIDKYTVILTAGIFLLCGCMPSIVVQKRMDEKEGKPVIEYRLGTPVEMDDWVTLKKKVCDDLNFATEGLPADTRRTIFEYACIKDDKYELGATLEKLQPGQIDQICVKLSEKGYAAKSEKVMTRPLEAGVFAGIIVMTVLIFVK